jgi:hypothetical protein
VVVSNRYAAAAGSWAAAAPIEAFEPDANREIDFPQLAAAADGTVYAVWQQLTALTTNTGSIRDYALYLDARLPGVTGSAWSGAVLLSDFPSGAQPPQIAITSDSTVFVAWVGRLPEQSISLAAATRFNASNYRDAPSAAEPVYRSSIGQAYGSAIAVDSKGDATAVYLQGEQGFQIWASRFE